MKMMMIEWVDSCGTTKGWNYKDEIEPILPSRCTSVGFVIEENDEYITLLQSETYDQVMCRLTIPAQAIMDTWILQKTERE